MDTTRKLEKELERLKVSEAAMIEHMRAKTSLRCHTEEEIRNLQYEVKETKKRSFVTATQLNEAKGKLRTLDKEHSGIVQSTRKLLEEITKLELDEWAGRSRVRAGRKALRDLSGQLGVVNEALEQSETVAVDVTNKIAIRATSLDRKINESQSVLINNDQAMEERAGLASGCSQQDEKIGRLKQRENNLKVRLNEVDDQIEEVEKLTNRVEVSIEQICDERRRLALRIGELNKVTSRIDVISDDLKEHNEKILFLANEERKKRKVKSYIAGRSLGDLEVIKENVRKQIRQVEIQLIDAQIDFEHGIIPLSAAEDSDTSLKDSNTPKELNSFSNEDKQSKALKAEIVILRSQLIRSRRQVIETQMELKTLELELPTIHGSSCIHFS